MTSACLLAAASCAERVPTLPANTSLQAQIGPFQRSASLKPRSARANTKTVNVLGLPSVTASGHSAFEQLMGTANEALANNGLCPPDMASIDDRFCVDRYEGSLVEVLSAGDERPFSPFDSLDGPEATLTPHVVRAVSEPNVIPQAYISGDQARQACARSGKRLCKRSEWQTACKGPQNVTFGYGAINEAGRCNDHGRAPMGARFGVGGDSPGSAWGHQMNDPQLNQLSGTVAPTGSHEGCTNGYGVYDMVGNLHEWVADRGGAFFGGYYLDIHQNGDGCDYGTFAHANYYHDYSTGFRCCADVAQ